MTEPETTEPLDFDIDDPDLCDRIADKAFESGGYPYKKRMGRSEYEDALLALQIELVKLQDHVKTGGERLIVVFEGRDAAGKGGTIARFRQYLNPRAARIVALPKPSDRERGEWYFQRYVDQFPTRGEMVLFDRSWYNRGVVEPVMGFCTAEQTRIFLQETPAFENMLVRDGFRLFKFWLNIGREMQLKRFHDRRHDPLKSWKISPVDMKAIRKWDDYTAARDRMLAATHTESAPWTIIRSNDKRRLRVNAIRHVLTNIDYAGKDKKAIGTIDPKILGLGPSFFKP